MLLAEGLHIHLAQSGVQIAHTIHMGGNVVHGLPDAVIAGIGIQALMELVVQRDEVIAQHIVADAGGAILPFQQTVQLTELCLIQVAGQAAQQSGFQHLAHGIALVDVLDRDLGDDAAALRQHIHQPFALEHHQCFVDGRAAHDQMLAQLRLAQLAAGLQLDVHDILAQDTVGVGPVVLVRLARVHQQRQDAGLVIFHW